ncbi:MAG: metallophosphoesterase family protein [Beijerinckiaceae bacterium]
MTTRIAIVTDIHHGKDAEAKKGSNALRLLETFAGFVAEQQHDLVLDLGDRISDEARDTDLVLEREVNAAFAPVRAVAPVLHICGNHDRDFLSVADNEQILGQSLGNTVLDLGDWQLALFRADTRMRRPLGFNCPQSDIDWLAETVAAADRPLLIASHVPLSGHGQDGNYYFENTPGYSRYPQTPQLREILKSCKQPLLCLAGHVHWNTVTTVDGVTHLTQQSLTESFTMSAERGRGEPCGAYGMLELGAEGISWRVHGSDAFALTIPVQQLARRWYHPLPPLGELKDESGRQARIEAYDKVSAAG